MANNLFTLGLDVSATKSRMNKQLKQISKELSDAKAMQVAGGLDIAQSQKQIQQQLNSISKNLTVDVQVDTVSAKQQIDMLNKQLSTGIKANSIKIPFQFDLSDSKAVKKEIDKIVAEITNNQGNLVKYKINIDENGQASKALLTYKNELNEVTNATLKLENVGKWYDANGMEHNIVKWSEGQKSLSQNIEATAKANQKQIESDNQVIRKKEELIAQMNLLTTQANKAGIALNSDNQNHFNDLSVNASTTDDIKQLETYLKLARTEYQTFNAEIAKGTHASSLETMKNNLQSMPSDIALLEARFNSIKAPEQVNQQIGQLKANMQSINGVSDPNEKIQKYNEMITSLQNLQKQYQVLSQEQKNVNSSLGAMQGGTTLTNRIVAWMAENREAAIKYDSELKQIILDSQDVTSKTDISRLQQQFRGIQTQVEATKASSTGFISELKSQIGDALTTMIKYQLAYQIISETANAIKSMANAVVDLDTNLTEFNKVADLSTTQLQEFSEKAYEAVDNVGRTGSDMIKAATEFKRAGYDLNESLNMGDAALVMTNVADGINNTSDAASTLISVLNGFNMDSANVMTIVDKMNSVSNQSPVGFDNLADGLERVSGTMNQAGNSLDETIGMLTGGFAQLRNMEKVSSGLITISQRLRAVDEDGTAIDGLASELDSAFGSIGVSIEDSNGELRTTYEILNDYAEVFPTLTSEQKQYFGELAAGKRQINVFNAIVDEMSTVDKAINQSTDSLHSAEKENEIYRKSIMGMKNELDNQFQKLSNAAIDSQWLKDLVDVGTEFLSLTTDIIEKDDLISGTIGIITKGLKESLNILSQIASNDAMGTVIKGLITYKTVAKGVDIFNYFKDKGNSANAMNEFFKSAINGTLQVKDGVIQVGKTIETTNVATASLATTEAGTTVATTSLSTAFKGLTTSLKGFALAHPVIAALAGISIAVVGATKAYDELTISQDEAMEMSQELTKNYTQDTSDLDSNISKYKELQSKLKDASLTTEEVTAAKESLVQVQDTLQEKYSSEAKGIDLVNGKYDEQIAKLDKIAIGKAKEYVASNKTGIDSDKKYLTEQNNNRIGSINGYKLSNDMKSYLDAYEDLTTRVMGKKSGEQFLQGRVEIKLDGIDTEDAREKLTKLSDDINSKFGDSAEAEKLRTDISNLMGDAFPEDKITEAKERIAKYTEAQVIANDKLRPLYQETTNVIGQYKEELAKGVDTTATENKINDLRAKLKDSLKDFSADDKKSFSAVFDVIFNTQSVEKSVKKVQQEVSKTSITLDVNVATNMSSFEKNFKKLQDKLVSISDVTTSDISELMTQFPDFNWDMLLDKNGQVKTDITAIQDAIILLRENLKETAIKACPQFKNAIEDMFYGTKEIDGYKDEIDDLNKVIKVQNKTGSISSDKANELIAKYPELASKVTKVGDAYVIEKDALQDVISARTVEANKAISTEVNTTNSIISSLQKRVKGYESECNAYIKSLNAKQKANMTNMKDARKTYNQYIGSYGDEGLALKAYESVYGKNTWTALHNAVISDVSAQLDSVDLSGYTKKLSSLYSTSKSLPSSTKSSSSSGSKSKSSSSSDKSSTSSKFDWIERRLNKLSETADKAKNKISSLFNYVNKNAKADQAIKAIESEISAYSNAGNKYMKKANSLGLTSGWINKIKNGAYDISTIKDEKLADKIQAYQDYYDSAQECYDKVSELKNEEKELNAQKISNIKEYYDAVNSLNNSKSSYWQTTIDSRTDRGWSTTSENYTKELNNLLASQKTELKFTKEQRDKLNALNLSMFNSNKIDYKDYQANLITIKQMDTEIVKLNSDIAKTNNTIKEITLIKLEDIGDTVSAKIERQRAKINAKLRDGEKVNESEYIELIKGYTSSKENKLDRINYITERLNENDSNGNKLISDNSELWRKYNSEINTLKGDIESIDDSTAELKSEMYDRVWWESIKKANEDLEKMGDTYSSLVELIEDSDVFDSKGNITNAGMAKFAMMSQELNNAKKLYIKAQNDMTTIDADYESGKMSKSQYAEKKEDANSRSFTYLTKIKSLSKDINDLSKAGNQAEIDALKKVNELRKEAYDRKKSYYDYDKSIKEKTADIKALQAQAAALGDVASAEGLAEKARLEAQIKEKKDELNDTVIDHKFELVTEGLDEMVNDLQDTYDKQVDALKGNLDAQISAVEDVTNALGKASNDTLVFLNDYIKGMSGSDYSVNSILSSTEGGKQQLISMQAMTDLQEFLKNTSIINTLNTSKYGDLANSSAMKYLKNQTSSVINDFNNLINIEGDVTQEKLDKVNEVADKVLNILSEQMRKNGFK